MASFGGVGGTSRGERVRRHTFAAFKAKVAEVGHLDVFLGDSGNINLYRARLTAIEESGTEEPIPCPDRDRSPDY
jgi:hypothetical protein